MQNKTWLKISNNDKLLSFCNRILNYNSILNTDAIRNMFLVSLISADSLVDVHSCDETIEISNFILSNIVLMLFENDDIKTYITNHLQDAIKIAKRDKKKFINKLKNNKYE